MVIESNEGLIKDVYRHPNSLTFSTLGRLVTKINLNTYLCLLTSNFSHLEVT